MEPPEDLRIALDAILRSSALPATLGARLVAWAPGTARVDATASAEHANLGGTAHGGFVTSLADAAFEVACNSHGRIAVALSLAGTFTAPAPVGVLLVAQAVEVSRSRGTASYRVEVTAGGGHVLAWYQAVAYRTGRWHLGEDAWPAAWREAH